MKLQEAITRDIFSKFLYSSSLKYSELWNKKICSSSHFDYYFKKILEEDLLIKQEEHYTLSNKGQSYISELDIKEITSKKRPLICSFLLGKKEKNELLIQQRSKQPFKGYLSVPGGKVEYGETTKECALREFKEETGLTCIANLKIIAETITYDIDSKEIIHHMIGYYYLGEDISGDLISETKEGKNMWISLDKYNETLRFPELDTILPKILGMEKSVDELIIKRYSKNGVIESYEIEKN